MRRWSRRAFLRASAVFAGAAALPGTRARAASPPQALSRASRVFLDRGLFIGAWVTTPQTGRYFPSVAEWQESGCNTATFYEPAFYNARIPARQWALAAYPAGGLRAPGPAEQVLGAADQHGDRLFSICFGSEELHDHQIVNWLADWFALTHAQHPDALAHCNQSANEWSEAQLRSYVRTAKPDLVTFDAYHFSSPDPYPGGGRPDIYDALALYRKVALEGHDGTGDSPIAFGHYTAGFKGGAGYTYVPSESELNLDYFAAWTMGARWTNLFRWERDSTQFLLYGADGRHTPQFRQFARIAREGRRLSPFLVRLSSTDVRIVPGRHLDGSGTAADNARPRRVPVWDSLASPYIDRISVPDLAGDVVIGYFRPLPGLGPVAGLPPTAARQFTEKYVKPFMLLNGGVAPNSSSGTDSTDGSAAGTAQRITVGLNRLGGENRLLRVNRNTGRLDRIPLRRTGGTDEFTVTIEGGAADLFFLTTRPTYDQPPVLTATADRPTIEPGGQFTINVTATNATADQPMPDVRARLLAPPGWSTTPDGSIRLGDLSLGHTGTTSWQVTAPTDAAAGRFALSTEITYQYAPSTDIRGGARAHAAIPIPYPVLSDSFGNVGVTDDAAPGSGNLDGNGNSYSALALAAAGVTPGSSVAGAGVRFTWPAIHPDNVVAAGQAVMIGESGATLGFLGCCTNGPGGGKGRIVYSDGTQQHYELSYPDWYGTPPAGTDIAAHMPYRNAPTGQDNNRVNVYAAAVDIDPTKTVDTVILPDLTPGAVAMHIFAIGIS